MAENPADNPTAASPEKRYRDELEKLRKREQFLRSVLETQEDMICRFLPDTTLTFVNGPYCRAFGCTAEELIGTRFLDPVPEDSRHGVLETLSALSASNKSITFSMEVTLPDGSTGWHQWTHSVITGSKGDVIEIQATGHDITRQKLIERELVFQTRLQELLMSISSTYISIPEAEVDDAIHHSLAELGQFAGADRLYIFEYDFERNTSTNSYEWCAEGIKPQIDFLQDYPNEHISEWVDTHRSGDVMHVPDVSALPADSTIRQMLEPRDIKAVIAVPMMDRRDCVGFVGMDFVRQPRTVTGYVRRLLAIFAQMMVSVQNRIRIQKSLHESERFMADLIDKSPSIITVKDKDGCYQLVNQTWQNVTGISRKIALGRTDSDLFDPDTAESFMVNDRHVLETGETTNSVEVLGSGKEMRHFLNTKFPVRNVRGTITSVCGMYFEITEMKKAEEHRIALLGAEAASRAKSSFLSSMNHEIRTPLNAIIGFTRVLERDATLSEKQAEYISTVLRSSEQLVNLVNQTLAYSRIDANTDEVKPTRFRIRQLVGDVVHMFSPKAYSAGLILQSEVAQQLPKFIIADEVKIRQVLITLLGNALQSTAKGSVTLRVGLRDSSEFLAPAGPAAKAYSEEGDRPQDPIASADRDAATGRDASTGSRPAAGSNGSTRIGKILIFFEVADTGSGIEKERLAVIFSKRSQSGESLQAGDTGPGLPLARDLAYLMQGNIEVESTPGEGSRFRLVLPVSTCDDAEGLDEPGRNKVMRKYIAALPNSAVREIRAATLEGDMNGLRKLAEEMAVEHEAVSTRIKELVSAYDYDTLLELFEDTGSSDV